MRFAYYSVEGLSLSWQRRLYDEGHDVLVFIDKEKGRFTQRVGDRLVPKTANFDTWLKFGAHPDAITFFDFTGKGELADGLRRSGRLVIGSGSFMDKLEDDRPFGESIATQHGILSPPSFRFSTISAAIEFLKRDPQQKHGDGGWAWKPNKDLGSDATWVDKTTAGMIGWLQLWARPHYGDNQPCLLQERIPGVALSTERWWNGKSWVGPYIATLEEKKFMPDDIGPSTGCSMNLIWFYPNEQPRIAEELKWESLAETWRKRDAPPGLYDINAIVNRQGAWFLEWTPRLGYDSEMTSQRGISNLAEFLAALVLGKSVDEFFDLNQIYVGVRCTVPPYPEDERVFKTGRIPSKDVPILDGLDGLWQKRMVAMELAKGEQCIHTTGGSGIVGIIVAEGSSLKGCCDDIYAYLGDTLSVPDMQYRPDCEKNLQADIDEMAQDGWETTPVIDGSAEEVA